LPSRGEWSQDSTQVRLLVAALQEPIDMRRAPAPRSQASCFASNSPLRPPRQERTTKVPTSAPASKPASLAAAHFHLSLDSATAHLQSRTYPKARRSAKSSIPIQGLMSERRRQLVGPVNSRTSTRLPRPRLGCVEIQVRPSRS